MWALNISSALGDVGRRGCRPGLRSQRTGIGGDEPSVVASFVAGMLTARPACCGPVPAVPRHALRRPARCSSGRRRPDRPAYADERPCRNARVRLQVAASAAGAAVTAPQRGRFRSGIRLPPGDHRWDCLVLGDRPAARTAAHGPRAGGAPPGRAHPGGAGRSARAACRRAARALPAARPSGCRTRPPADRHGLATGAATDEPAGSPVSSAERADLRGQARDLAVTTAAAPQHVIVIQRWRDGGPLYERYLDHLALDVSYIVTPAAAAFGATYGGRDRGGAAHRRPGRAGHRGRSVAPAGRAADPHRGAGRCRSRTRRPSCGCCSAAPVRGAADQAIAAGSARDAHRGGRRRHPGAAVRGRLPERRRAAAAGRGAGPAAVDHPIRQRRGGRAADRVTR